ncbi:MAG: hypothetical protein ACJZ79_02785 [Pseudohongiellaceae bacterium]
MIKTKMSVSILLALLAFSSTIAANEGTIAFIGATIIDGTDAPPIRKWGYW